MIFGINIDKTNPSFTMSDFVFWMPKFKTYVETEAGAVAYNKIYEICNQKIFKSIFGSDWEQAISLAIAHYLTLRAKQLSATNDGTAAGIAGNDNYGVVLSGVSVGSFSKSFDLGQTLVEGDDAKFWNLTSYGAQLMALYKQKSPPSVFVVTPTNPCKDPIAAYYAAQCKGSIDIIMRENAKLIRQWQKDLDNKQDKGDYVVSVEKEGE